MDTPLVVLEPVACDICGSTASDEILTTRDRAHDAPGVFTFRRCRTCGLIYQNPRPSAESFGMIYPGNYGPYQAETITPTTIHSDLRRTCRFINKLQPIGGRLLDVGCGPGKFLQALEILLPQWQSTGIEPDKQAALSARQQGLNVLHGRLEDGQLAKSSWDAITLWNVLEHLPSPVESLKRIRTLLDPKGVLYFAVPMGDSWDAALWRDSWIGWDLPRHFFAFDRSSLQRLLAATGFEIISTACVSGAEYGFTESLRAFVAEHITSYTHQRLAIAISYSRPFRLLLRPYIWKMEQKKRATVLTVAARPLP